jgi:hypothetical protein
MAVMAGCLVRTPLRPWTRGGGHVLERDVGGGSLLGVHPLLAPTLLLHARIMFLAADLYIHSVVQLSGGTCAGWALQAVGTMHSGLRVVLPAMLTGNCDRTPSRRPILCGGALQPAAQGVVADLCP